MPNAWLEPAPRRETERLVNIAPTELRRRTSRLRRTTVKWVGSEAEAASSPVRMFSAPTSNAPTLPVRRAPPTIGTTRPPSRPIFRL